MREVVHQIPASLTEGPSIGFAETIPDGHRGDLWRCDNCQTLWRIGESCDWCDRTGRTDGRCGAHIVHMPALAWRPATPWQRLIHRNHGRKTP